MRCAARGEFYIGSDPILIGEINSKFEIKSKITKKYFKQNSDYFILFFIGLKYNFGAIAPRLGHFGATLIDPRSQPFPSPFLNFLELSV